MSTAIAPQTADQTFSSLEPFPKNTCFQVRADRERSRSGADKVTIEEFETRLDENLERLHQELRDDFGYGSGGIGRIDAQTMQLTYFMSPTPDTRARRGKVDAQNRLWFGEYGGNAIGMLDPKSGAISEWRLPTPWSAPYDAVLDRNGEVWTGSVMSDRVARLNQTGQFVEYLLPRETNIRRVFVDNSTTPVTFWVGSNHGASIVKLGHLIRASFDRPESAGPLVRADSGDQQVRNRPESGRCTSSRSTDVSRVTAIGST